MHLLSCIPKGSMLILSVHQSAAAMLQISAVSVSRGKPTELFRLIYSPFLISCLLTWTHLFLCSSISWKNFPFCDSFCNEVFSLGLWLLFKSQSNTYWLSAFSMSSMFLVCSTLECSHFALYGIASAWHELKSSERREPKLRNAPIKFDSRQACKVFF